MIDSLAEDFKMRFNEFASMLQIYISLKTHYPLKSVMLQKTAM
jgi:hypothetical protein